MAASDQLRSKRQEVLEEFVEVMVNRRTIFESTGTTDIGSHNEDHSYDDSQLKSDSEEVFSIFFPRLLSLRVLEMCRETRRILLERQQMYRRWLQELVDEDERVVVRG